MDTLQQLKTGDKCIVRRVYACGDIKRRLLDLGIIKGTLIEAVGGNITGNLMAYCVRGGIIALQVEDANSIAVEKINNNLISSFERNKNGVLFNKKQGENSNEK